MVILWIHVVLIRNMPFIVLYWAIMHLFMPPILFGGLVSQCVRNKSENSECLGPCAHCEFLLFYTILAGKNIDMFFSYKHSANVLYAAKHFLNLSCDSFF